MLQKIRELGRNDFVRHNAVFFVGSLSVSAINYLYYPIIGRLVSTTNFGEVQAIVSISLQVSLLLMVVGNVTVNIVANSSDETERNQLVSEFGRLAVFIMVLLIVLALPFIHPIEHFLHFTSVVPFLVLCVVLLTAALVTPYLAFLRGVKRFGSLSLASATTAVTRLLAAAALILLGLGVNGAIGGIVLAQIATLTYVVWAAKKYGLHSSGERKWWHLPKMALVKPQLPFAALVLIVTTITTLMFSSDVVLAKHYFSPHDAGLYAGIATISRIIYFLTASVSTVLLSSIKISEGREANRRTLVKSLMLVAGLGGMALIAFVVAPRFFIHLLLGKRYLELAYLLPWLSLALFLISVINLVFLYDLALRRWSVAYIGLTGLSVTAVLIGLHHAAPRALIQSLLLGAIFTLSLRALDSLRRSPQLAKLRLKA